jgi:hypothetical protein
MLMSLDPTGAAKATRRGRVVVQRGAEAYS